MYQDVNGKKGYRAMKGASGKTYGNLQLLTPAELAGALADGIAEYTPPPPPPPTQSDIERVDKQDLFEQLRDDGHWPTVKAALAGNEDLQDYWDNALRFRVDHPEVVAMATVIGEVPQAYFNKIIYGA